MVRCLAVCRRLKSQLYRTTTAQRSLSSLKKDPSKFVYNVSKDRVLEDPVVAEYFKANYPEVFEEEQEYQKAESFGSEVAVAEDNVATPESEPETEASKLNIRSLTCYLRDAENEEGSRGSQRLRDDHVIPGLLYGGDPALGIHSRDPASKTLIKTPWKYLQRELDRYHRSFESRVYDLTVLESPDDDSGGTVHRVIPKNVQRHPVQSTIYCANFCRYHAGRPIKLPLVYANEEESPALKRDGFIVPIQRFIECFVDEGTPIPERIELECTDLQFKEVIRTDRVILPNNVRFSDRVIKKGDDFILGVVHGKNRGADDDDEDGDDENAE